MKSALELYGEYCNKEWGWDPADDYQPLLDEFGDILLQVDEDNYQGDSLVLYGGKDENEGKFGFLTFGWGSCSGCDALQACGNILAIQELMNKLEASIRWFETKKEIIYFFEDHDWDGEFIESGLIDKFVDRAIPLLQILQ